MRGGFGFLESLLGRGAGNGHGVLEALFDHLIVTVKDVQKLTGTTHAAANSLVSRLVDVGILGEITGYARNRRFRYTPYIALFSDTTSGSKKKKAVFRRGPARGIQ